MEYSRPLLVYRLGGSAFEVSIRQVDGGTFKTLSSVYDQHLGGNDFNQRVIDHLLLAHKSKTGRDLSGDQTFLLRSLTINKMYTFSTTEDNQDRVVIRVFEGVGKRTNQNLFLGAIELTGITPALKGVPQIRVRLSTYASGTYINLNVMDVASGRSNAAIFFASKEWNDYYGLNSECEFTESGAFELEPAGKLTLSHSHYIKITE